MQLPSQPHVYLFPYGSPTFSTAFQCNFFRYSTCLSCDCLSCVHRGAKFSVSTTISATLFGSQQVSPLHACMCWVCRYWVYFDPTWDWKTALTYSNYAQFFDKTVKMIEPMIGVRTRPSTASSSRPFPLTHHGGANRAGSESCLGYSATLSILPRCLPCT